MTIYPHSLFLLLRLGWPATPWSSWWASCWSRSRPVSTTWARAGWRDVPEQVAAVPSATALLTIFLLLNGAAQVLAMPVLDIQLFDRYLLGFIPFVAGLVLALTRAQGLFIRPTRAAAAVALVALALVGMQAVAASDASDGRPGPWGRRRWPWAIPLTRSTEGSRGTTTTSPARWTFPRRPRPSGTSCSPPGRRSAATTELRPEQVSGGHLRVLATERATTLFGQHLDFVLRPGPDPCPVPHG